MLKVGNYVSLGEVIGRGSFGQVYHGMHKKTKEGVAIKEMDMSLLQKKSPKLILHLQNEINIMKEMKHENIVCLLECKTAKNIVYLVLEYCSIGDLQAFLNKQPFNKLSEEMTKYFMLQLASGLQFLRSKDVIHRDLKPENLLLCVGPDANLPILKIADFGFARHIESGNLAETLCGSPLHMAPEILSNQPYTVKSDLWSVGTIMYQMLFGTPLFQCNNFAQLFQAAKFQPIIIPNTISPDSRDLLTGLLQRDPNLRLDWDEFFNHPYFEGRLSKSQNLIPNSPIQQNNNMPIVGGRSPAPLLQPLPESPPIFHSVPEIPPPNDSLIFSVSELPFEDREDYCNYNNNSNNVNNQNQINDKNSQPQNNQNINQQIPNQNQNQINDKNSHPINQNHFPHNNNKNVEEDFVIVERFSPKEILIREAKIKDRVSQCEALGLLAKDLLQKGEEGKSLSLYYKSLQILQLLWKNLIDLIKYEIADQILTSLLQSYTLIKELYKEHLTRIESLQVKTGPTGVVEAIIYESAVSYSYRAYFEEVSSKNFGLSLEYYKFSKCLLSILCSEHPNSSPTMEDYTRRIQSRIDYLQLC